MSFSLPSLLATAGNYLQPLGPVAGTEREHLIHVILIALVAIGPAMIATPIILWRYRRGNARAAYAPKWGGNRLLEICMWGVPIAVVGLLSYNIWRTTHRLDPYKPISGDELIVQVVGLDWKWVFIYPGQNAAAVNELILPAGRPVHLVLTTDTVMQSFQIPALAGQMYAMPGMTTHQWLVASTPGITKGFNAQFSGTSFSKQEFTVRTLPPDEFAAAMATLQSAPPLDVQAYAQLAAPGTVTAPLHFRLATPQLFQRVLARYHTGQPLAAEAQPGSPAYQPETATLPAAEAMTMPHHHD